MTGTIPVNELVNVTPSVLGVGGSAVDLNGLVLTSSTRIPVGSTLSFGSQAGVAAFFGASSKEASIAGVYFSGFDTSTVKPATLLFTQFVLNAVSAYLQGGNVSGISLTTLQSYNGVLAVTIDGSPKTNTI